MLRMTTEHFSLIQIMQILGYHSDSGGICFGVAHMGTQAVLANDIKTFNERLKIIRDLWNSAVEDALKEKQKELTKKLDEKLSVKESLNISLEVCLPLIKEKVKKEMASFSTEKRNDIYAFFDGVELYQQAYLYPHLFKKKVGVGQDSELSSSLVSPKILEQEGGLVETIKSSGLYSLSSLTAYFKTLQEALDKGEKPLKGPFMIVFNSSRHTVSVGYNPLTRSWIFIDANQLPPKNISSPEEIANNIMRAYSKEKITDKTSISLSSTFHYSEKYSDDFDTHRAIWADEWEKIHMITPEKAQEIDSEGVNWLYTAVKSGELNTVIELCENKADINQTNSKGNSPLFLAIEMNDIEMVKTLLEFGADFRKPNNGGFSPLHIAAQNGYVAIFDLLIEAGANYNHINHKGETPLATALDYNQYKIVESLLDHIFDNSKTLIRPLKDFNFLFGNIIVTITTSEATEKETKATLDTLKKITHEIYLSLTQDLTQKTNLLEKIQIATEKIHEAVQKSIQQIEHQPKKTGIRSLFFSNAKELKQNEKIIDSLHKIIEKKPTYKHST